MVLCILFLQLNSRKSFSDPGSPLSLGLLTLTVSSC
jgi:hypothetical protein